MDTVVIFSLGMFLPIIVIGGFVVLWQRIFKHYPANRRVPWPWSLLARTGATSTGPIESPLPEATDGPRTQAPVFEVEANIKIRTGAILERLYPGRKFTKGTVDEAAILNGALANRDAGNEDWDAIHAFFRQGQSASVAKGGAQLLSGDWDGSVMKPGAMVVKTKIDPREFRIAEELFLGSFRNGSNLAMLRLLGTIAPLTPFTPVGEKFVFNLLDGLVHWKDDDPDSAEMFSRPPVIELLYRSMVTFLRTGAWPANYVDFVPEFRAALTRLFITARSEKRDTSTEHAWSPWYAFLEDFLVVIVRVRLQEGTSRSILFVDEEGKPQEQKFFQQIDPLDKELSWLGPHFYGDPDAKWEKEAPTREEVEATLAWLGDHEFLNLKRPVGYQKLLSHRVRALRAAAANGERDAQVALGAVELSCGMEGGVQRAFELFLRAARQGSPRAIGYLANMDLCGDWPGRVQSDQQLEFQVPLLRVAARLGHIDSQAQLGLMWPNTDWGWIPENEAMYWLQRAAEVGGHPEARDAWRERRWDLYVEQASLGTQIEPLAERGDPEAQRQVAEAYYYGIGVAKDEDSAISWVERAAEQGHLLAICDRAIYACWEGEPFYRWARVAEKHGSLAPRYFKHASDLIGAKNVLLAALWDQAGFDEFR